MTDAPRPHPARALWQLLEPLHAIAYFDEEVIGGLKALGLKGFWMGYFAGRAAPLGAVGPGVVEATFYNFDPAMVRRAIPDAWRFAEPVAVLEARSLAAAACLRRLAPSVDGEAERVVPLLSSAVRSGRPDGRPLFAANQQLPLPDDPVAALWHCATALREHRGDGHVAILVAEDIAGIEAHQLAVAATGIADDRLRGARGWSEEAWNEAKARLVARDVLDETGLLTPAGAALRDRIEHRTDQLALQPFRDGLTEPGLDLLPSLLRPLTSAVLRSGTLPFPNPIGLSPPES